MAEAKQVFSVGLGLSFDAVTKIWLEWHVAAAFRTNIEVLLISTKVAKIMKEVVNMSEQPASNLSGEPALNAFGPSQNHIHCDKRSAQPWRNGKELTQPEREFEPVDYDQIAIAKMTYKLAAVLRVYRNTTYSRSLPLRWQTQIGKNSEHL